MLPWTHGSIVPGQSICFKRQRQMPELQNPVFTLLFKERIFYLSATLPKA